MSPTAGDSTLAEQPAQQLGGDSSIQEDTDELWSSILKSVASSKMVPTKNVLVLGDKESGKTTLIARLKGSDDEFLGKPPDDSPLKDKRQGSDLALSYNYVDIKDDDSEDAEDTVARLGLYQLAGSHEAYHSLLRFVLNTTALADTLVVIVLDWSRPWTFMETLQRWIKVVEEGLEAVKKEGASGSKDGWTKGRALLDELKDSLERFIRSYTEPADAKAAANPANPANTANPTNITTQTVPVDESDLLPLKPGTLTTNLGVPLIVVCAKSDHIFDMKEQQFYYIQQSLRTVCLKYGAALFYTSTRQPSTFINLRAYTLHRLLHNKSSPDPKYAFNTKPLVANDDVVMVPAGWDSWNLINVDKFDCESLANGWDHDMERVGKKAEAIEGSAGGETSEEIPSAKKIYGDLINHEVDVKPLAVQPLIIAEDEQAFFERHEKSLKSNKDNERPPTAPSVVGPIGAAAFTAYTNIGGLDDVESKLSKLALKQEQQNRGAPPSAPGAGAPNGTTNGAQSQAPGAAQNEVIANFFQQLLTKKGNTPMGTTSGRGSSSQTSPNSSNTNLSLSAKTTSISTNGSTRKLVKEELEKMRPASTSATAGTVGK